MSQLKRSINVPSKVLLFVNQISFGAKIRKLESNEKANEGTRAMHYKRLWSKQIRKKQKQQSKEDNPEKAAPFKFV